MDNTLTECAAVDETVVFLNYFKDLEDPRQQGKVDYPLEEILLLCLLAVVAGVDTRHRYRRVRPQEAEPAASLPAVHKGHTGARSPRRHPGCPGPRAVPALLH